MLLGHLLGRHKGRGGGRAGGGVHWLVSEECKKGGREQPKSFLHLLPEKERDEHVSGFVWTGPLLPSPGML